jgi:hypothetical protein
MIKILSYLRSSASSADKFLAGRDGVFDGVMQARSEGSFGHNDWPLKRRGNQKFFGYFFSKK